MKFYEMNFKMNRQPYWAEPNPFPASLNELALAAEDPVKKIRYDIKSGRRRGSKLSYSVWSDELIGVLKSCGASGYAAYDVDVFLGNKVLDGYHGVRITGRGGPFDETRSQAVKIGNVYDSCNGIYMVEKEWDGSDIFSIPGLGFTTYLVEKVAIAVIRANLQDIELVPNDECEM